MWPFRVSLAKAARGARGADCATAAVPLWPLCVALIRSSWLRAESKHIEEQVGEEQPSVHNASLCPPAYLRNNIASIMLVSLTAPSIICADDAGSSSSPSRRSVTSPSAAANADESSSSSFSAALVGGKAASLAKLYSNPRLSGHVPEAFALTIDFFRPLIEQVLRWKNLFQRARERRS